MTLTDMHILIQYKRYRNSLVHNDYWEPVKTQATEQMQNALALLSEAVLKSDFLELLKKAIRWLYKCSLNNLLLSSSFIA